MTGHWPDEILAEYVLGTLDDEATSTAIAAAAAASTEFAARLAWWSETLGAAGEAIAAGVASLSASASLGERLSSTLDTTNRFARFAPVVADTLGVDTAAALAMLGRLDDADVWSDGVLPQTRMWPVPRPGEDVATWLKMPAGMDFPEHTHLGSETVVVLQGWYLDDDDVLHPPGSVLVEDGGSHHSFRIDAAGPEFICLAVIEGGIRIGDSELTRESIYGV